MSTASTHAQQTWKRRIVPPLVFVAMLNTCAWLALFGVAGRDVTLLGIGAMAYFFGLRHAFDVDHIAAIDNVTRKLRQDGKRPVAAGLFFSLGHSTVVILLSLVLALAARETEAHMGVLREVGGLVGTVVSALFLTLIGLVNLRILIQLLRTLWRSRNGSVEVATGDMALVSGGLLSYLFGRIYRNIRASWQMYPVGFLFGLGFDTATEIAILGISAGLAQHGSMDLLGVMTFPLLFTAGMSLMDTLDGLVMLRIYDWAMADTMRKMFFNTAVTAFSVVVALFVGGVEWAQLVFGETGSGSWIHAALVHLDFGTMGLAVTVLMLVFWGAAVLYYRMGIDADTKQGPECTFQERY